MPRSTCCAPVHEVRCAKVCKKAAQCSFRQALDCTEKRRDKKTRQACAMVKGTRTSRQVQAAACPHSTSCWLPSARAEGPGVVLQQINDARAHEPARSQSMQPVA